jgi:hypothetical protein
MSLSLAGAIKAKLESTASSWKPSAVAGCPWFRDNAPEGQAYPYGTISEGLSFVPSAAIAGLGTEMVQVDVWQTWKPETSPDNAAGYDGLHKENPLLGPNVARALHLVQFETAPQRAFFATVTNAIRLPDVDANVIHTAITLYVRRIL